MWSLLRSFPTCLTLAPGHRGLLATASSPRSLHTSRVSAVDSFYGQHSANVLWKASTTVSNPSRKRGRAKGLPRIRNLNRGQRLGYGKAKMVWPGLTQAIFGKDRERQAIGALDPAAYQKYEKDLEIVRKTGNVRRSRRKVSPLERGWTSATAEGKDFGPPVNLQAGYDYEGFKSILVRNKMVSHMSGRFGRVQSMSLLMLTGNQQGLAGFAMARARVRSGPVMFYKAILKASRSLTSIKLYDGRTVYHNIFSQFGSTRMFVYPLPPGHGIIADRVIKAACDVIGIKDLKVVTDGADDNRLHLIKAFFLGLMRQRTHQELADEKKLHLVEFTDSGAPDVSLRVLASPSNGHVRTQAEILSNEILDFEYLGFEGNLPYVPKEPDPLAFRGPDSVYAKKRRPHLGQYENRIQLTADYGKVRSYLTDIYPECKPADYKKVPKGDSATV